MSSKIKKNKQDETWDQKHNLIPIRIKASTDTVEKFTDLCDKYHVSRKMIINELMKEYIQGDIPLTTKRTTLTTKVDHALYLKMNDQCKNDGISKANAYEQLLNYFVDHAQTVLSTLGITDAETRPDELLYQLREIHIKKKRPVRTTDVSDSNIYTNTFGTWPTAIYACGSIDYPEFIKRRKANNNQFSANELIWIFTTRKDELQGADVDHYNFEYPGNAIYQSVMHCTIEELNAQLKAHTHG